MSCRLLGALLDEILADARRRDVRPKIYDRRKAARKTAGAIGRVDRRFERHAMA
jgi:hypothetical protein